MIDIKKIKKIVINLKRRPDRLEKFDREMNYIGWDYEIFEGVNIVGVDGCALSHVKVVEDFLKTDDEHIMILEDDCFFMPYAKNQLEKSLKELNNLEWDYFNLGPSLNRPINNYSDNLLDLTNLPPKDHRHRGIYGLACYIINRKFGEEFLKFKLESNQPIDVYLDEDVYPNFKCFASSTPIITQRNGFSDNTKSMDNNHYTILHNWNLYCDNKVSPLYYNIDYCEKEKNYPEKITIKRNKIIKPNPKTLIYTSIYSNLWGTEFGGRPSRGLHYKHSLKNILNLSPHKVICFTGEDEIDDLKKWFYGINNISEDKLEFILFDLKSTKYFSEIYKLKNIDTMKTSDRCFEIQYNKFLWLDVIPNLESYDKIYWFDSGLSHGGIFPEKYSFGGGYEKHYNFTLFNHNYVEHLNSITNDKLVISVKNNLGEYYWSSTIPHRYYNQFNNSEHVIGGFFGGNLSNMLEYKNKFVKLLEQLLSNESELYHEELIMSCLYQNNKDYFTTLKFDDWYDRGLPEVSSNNVKYFYNIFEIGYKTKTCVCTISIELGNGDRYLSSAKKLINTHLEFTNYDIVLITNKPEYFSDIINLRVKIVNYYDKFDESIISDNRFNMHLKRYPIQVSSEMGYENIFYNDCDCYITGWDDLSFSNKCKENFDVAFVSHANPQLGELRKNHPHFQEKINTEFVGLYYDELDESPNPAETRVIFKNNNKLIDFLHFWGLISKQNNNYFTYHDGVYFGTSSVYSKMNMIGITPNEDFSKYCRIQHSDSILDYFGNKIDKNDTHNLNKVETSIELNEVSYVPGAFDYKGLQTLQHKNVINVFRHLLMEIKPSTIIEIGTEFGGLTLLLQDLVIELELNAKIKTYDIKIPKFLVEHPDLTNLIEIRTKDIFTYNPFRLSDEGISEIKEHIVSDGINLILCDGGSKTKEFNSLSDIINVGDVIMLHDYIINEEEFELNFKDKIWNWHESKLSDIEESIIKNNLEPYLDEEFSKVVWGCFIKK